MEGLNARLVVTCSDRPGIIAAVARFLYERGANIVSSDQHSTDPEDGRFFLRMAVHFRDEGADLDAVRAEFEAEIAGPFGMDVRFRDARVRPRLAVLVSREEHCLLDLLWRARRGELAADVQAVVANHDVHRGDVEALGVPYHHVPVRPGGKAAAESAMLALLAGRVELVVLARYMQILSGDFLDRIGCPVINIHHSFLPAFAGAQPYARAYERGVKVIGATAHYVTEELDAGPIIAQDVAHVDHRAGPADLARIGRDIERVVLARAVVSHLDDRVLTDGNRTVVF
jgi:formyltetrahydrofolate deformylase